MNNWVFNAYSDVYSIAMMQDVKPQAYVAVAHKSQPTRFGKIVRLFGRA